MDFFYARRISLVIDFSSDIKKFGLIPLPFVVGQNLGRKYNDGISFESISNEVAPMPATCLSTIP